VIIISYANYEASELEDFEPRLVFVDAQNRQISQRAPTSGARARYA